MFIDGCFWHGCVQHKRVPKSNEAWWSAKLEQNKQRDAETTALLSEQGWRVLRFWEHDPVEDVVQASRNNGSAFDALLPLLERDQARRFVDPALEVECDLSMCSFLLTANDIDLVPAPLKDRCRVLRVPAPEWKHIGPIIDRIIGDIAEERGVGRQWFQPLAQDEMEIIKQAWTSGSLRHLRRIVETLLDGRDSIMGRC